ncbi:MAG: hypothetical protein Crog4KO_23640 [Crocinitomicaceae bacterium]
MHLVDKHIFDIRYDHESSAMDLQRRISTISNEKLFDVISEVFDEFDVPATVRLDRLELDIGRIRESYLEEDLLEAVAIALRHQLQEHDLVAARTEEKNEIQKRSTGNSLEVFEQFMLSGTIPWWIRDRNDFDIRTEIDRVMENHRDQIAGVVRKLAHRNHFLQRLVYNLSEKQLEQLVQVLAPAEAKQVLEATDNIKAVQNKRKLIPTDSRSYRNKVWEFVFTYLLVDRGTSFNQKMFVQATLTRLSHHFNVEYQSFLTLFHEAVEHLDKEVAIPKGLVQIIQELFSERDLVASETHNQKVDSTAEITAVYTSLVMQNPEFDRTFESQLLELIASKSKVFESFINRQSKNSELHKNLPLALSDKGLHQLIRFIEPTSQRVVIQFSNKVQGLKDSGNLPISGNSQEFRNAKWQFILRALLIDRGSQFNLKSFVKLTLAALAAHFNVELHDLMHYVFLELTASVSSDQGTLATVLLEIQEEEREKIVSASEDEKEKFKAKLKLQWLEYALAHGQAPAWSQRHNLQASDFQKILFEAMQRQPTEIQGILRHQLRANRKRHFLIRQLDEKGRHQIVRFLNTKAAEKVHTYDKLLDKIQERRSLATNKHEFESLKWSAILEILIEEKGSVFNYKTFVLRSLVQLSNRLNVSFETLFSYVIEVSSTLPNMPESPLQNALLSLHSEIRESKKKSDNLKNPLNNDLKTIWEKIKDQVPEDARYLLILLKKLQTDILFRTQFDLHEWLEKHPEIKQGHLLSIVQSLQWKPENFAKTLQSQPKKSVEKILAFLASEEHRFVQYYLKDLEKLLHFSFDNHAVLTRQATVFAFAFLSTTKRIDKHYFFQEMLHYLSKFNGVSQKELMLQIQKTIQEEAPQLNSTLALSISKINHNEVIAPEEDDSADTKLESNEKLESETQEIDEETLKELEETEEDLNGIYVENAGIIILWPFFRQLFGMLDMIEDDAFVSIAAKIRGIHLLQYMCTGETSHPEHELILNKILCGVPTNLPIDDSFEISPKEEEVIESMLLGVLANWSRMKDSSVEALRETFMIRSGKISFAEETIDMHVEKKTVDVLFESMPWTFTFVSLPWMKKPLRTIWN